MILPYVDISQSMVMDALNFTGTPSTPFSLLWSSSMQTASTATDLNCLMYHNLNMGQAGGTAKQNIYDNYNAGTNFSLGSWSNYNSDPNIILSWTITNNNTENDIKGNIYIYDTSGNPVWNYFYVVFANGGVDTQTDYDTGVAVSTINTKYLIALNAEVSVYIGPPPPPGAGVTGNITTATDSDSAGGGTSRFTINYPNFDLNTPPGNVFRIVNCTNNPVADIALNKRTDFQVTFN